MRFNTFALPISGLTNIWPYLTPHPRHLRTLESMGCILHPYSRRDRQRLALCRNTSHWPPSSDCCSRTNEPTQAQTGRLGVYKLVCLE